MIDLYVISEWFISWKFNTDLSLIQNYQNIYNFVNWTKTVNSFEWESMKSLIIKNFIITPTLIHFRPPTRGRSNWVVRSFFDLWDNFVRANFRMDSMEKGMYGLSENA